MFVSLRGAQTMTWWNQQWCKFSGRGTGGGGGQSWGKLWDCANPSCVAKGKNGNAASKNACFYCDMPYQVTLAKHEAGLLGKKEKAVADGKALAARLEAADCDADGFKPARKRRLSKKARRAAAAQAVGDKGATPPAQPNPPRAASAAPSSAPSGVTDLAMEVEPVEPADSDKPMSLEELQKLEATLVGPRPPRTDWVASDVVDGVVDDDTASAISDLRNGLTECDALLTVKGPLAASIDCKAIKLRHAELTKALAKAEKEHKASFSASVDAASLGLDMARYEKRWKDRLEFTQRGAAKARETFMRIQTQQQRHIALWQSRLDLSHQEEAKRQTAWTERHELLKAQHLEVMKEFETRLHQAEAASPSVGGSPPATSPATGQSARPALEAVPLALRPVADTARRSDMHLTASISPNDLPAPGKIEDQDYLAAVQDLWGSIEALSAMPGDTPASFQQMGATASLCQELVGKAIWDKYYMGRVINDHDVVPKNLMMRLSTQLTKTAEAYATSVASTLAATTRLELAFGYRRADTDKGTGARQTPY